jgi:hypothetical protein
MGILAVVGLTTLATSCQRDGAPPNNHVATKVDIRSEWSGFSPTSPITAEVTLDRAADGDYRLSSTMKKGQDPEVRSAGVVSRESVQALVDALSAPAQRGIALADLGVSITKVQEAVDETLVSHGLPGVPEASLRVKRYRQSLRNPQVLARTVARGFEGFHTDDYPYVSIRVQLDDGRVLSASSRSQHYLMLPWNRRPAGRSFAPGLPLAIGRLLPAEAVNRERLQSPIDDWSLGYLIRSGVYDDLDRLVAEALAGEAMHTVRDAFEVSDVRIFPPGSANAFLDATLALPTGASQVRARVRLPISSGRLSDESELGRIYRNLLAAKAVPFWSERLGGIPGVRFEVYGMDQWPSDALPDQFLADMRSRQLLLELGAPGALTDMILVSSEDWSEQWVVLRDGRVVLWRRGPEEGRPARMIAKILPARPGT